LRRLGGASLVDHEGSFLLARPGREIGVTHRNLRYTDTLEGKGKRCNPRSRRGVLSIDDGTDSPRQRPMTPPPRIGSWFLIVPVISLGCGRGEADPPRPPPPPAIVKKL